MTAFIESAWDYCSRRRWWWFAVPLAQLADFIDPIPSRNVPNDER